MKRLFRKLLPFAPFLYPTLALAVAANVTGTQLDGVVAMIIAVCTLYVTPLLFVGGMAYWGWCVLFGHHWGQFTMKLILVTIVLSGGIGLISNIFGGRVVTSVMM
jgi:hypothetical protein